MRTVPIKTAVDLIAPLLVVRRVADRRLRHVQTVVVDGDASNDNGNNKSGEQQHVGFGRQLMAEAERLSARAGYSKVAVIAGVGVRNYYRSRLGYRLSPGPGEFMVKDLSPAFRLRHHRFLGGALGAAWASPAAKPAGLRTERDGQVVIDLEANASETDLIDDKLAAVLASATLEDLREEDHRPLSQQHGGR